MAAPFLGGVVTLLPSDVDFVAVGDSELHGKRRGHMSFAAYLKYELRDGERRYAPGSHDLGGGSSMWVRCTRSTDFLGAAASTEREAGRVGLDEAGSA